MRTRRWTRSPNGKILGVATGLAEWRELPVDPVRMIIFFTILFTGFFPGAIIYLIVALALPMQTAADIIDDRSYSSFSERRQYRNPKYKYQDAEYEEAGSKTTDELKEEYENLKKKVEQMEEQMFDKEKDWDDRFNEGK